MSNTNNKPAAQWGHWLLVLLLFPILSVLLTGATKDKNKRKPVAESLPAKELVWPLPPETPRMRWEAQIRDLDNLSGDKKKRSLVERIAGVKPVEETKFRLRRPYGIAVDSHGRIYVADGAARSVFVIDRSARRVEIRTGSSRAPLALPVGVALDKDDRLFVSDSYLHSVLCFDPQGQVSAQFGRDQLQRAAGMALDQARRRLYVADVKGHRIAVFNPDNYAFERYIGGPSTGAREPGKFSAPTNVAVDRKGSLYVTDTWNHRVQIFDAAGKFIRAFGTHGIRPGQFVRPKGIAVDSEGHIYVADAEFNNFQIFSPEGKPLLAVGSLGNQPGEFVLITGLSIDSADRIYTTEQDDARVQVFKYLPQPGSEPGKEVVKAGR